MERAIDHPQLAVSHPEQSPFAMSFLYPVENKKAAEDGMRKYARRESNAASGVYQQSFRPGKLAEFALESATKSWQDQAPLRRQPRTL
jgi:hypothetical protein